MCYSCRYLYVDEGWCGSDVTPGNPPNLTCEKGHFDYEDALENRGGLKICLERADTCTDFEESSNLMAVLKEEGHK